VARYYHSAEARNARVSTEITGYAASACAWLHGVTGDEGCLEGASRAGRFLRDHAWDAVSGAVPFEWSMNGDLPAHHAYFFDTGIIARGLLHVHDLTRDPSLLEAAIRAAAALRLFLNAGDIHPILELPSLTPTPRDARWSRSSACYQLKSALAALQIHERTGDSQALETYEFALNLALKGHEEFPEGESPRDRVMDRLHAYCYFLEGLLPRAHQPAIAAVLAGAIRRTGVLLREIRPSFERSDVCAQLLRLRLFAAPQVPLDRERAGEEAAWAASHQIESEDPRVDGAFNFGCRQGAALPFANPVSTAFCAQALAAWRDYQQTGRTFDWHELI
jgi:hypothetical protein